MECNVYEAIKGTNFFHKEIDRKSHLSDSVVQSYMHQTLKAIDHMHRNGIFHRDIKPYTFNDNSISENLLLTGDILKLADLGSCRGIYSKQPYTEYISTRWYRAPECLLTDGYYNYKMDIWGAGCVMFEIISLFPLFPGNDELDQVHRIHNVLGSPPKALLDQFQRVATHMEFNFPYRPKSGIEKLIPHASPEVISLICNPSILYQ